MDINQIQAYASESSGNRPTIQQAPKQSLGKNLKEHKAHILQTIGDLLNKLGL